ncbi:hypothetical protein [Fluoribacter gormanii]|uniref:hypothetical protein n=1 Tax=Fluoribacter gormanii TaxID=464 RepID=UPI00104159CD|nr:hypothetical protein [Fluoribacter gormanii]
MQGKVDKQQIAAQDILEKYNTVLTSLMSAMGRSTFTMMHADFLCMHEALVNIAKGVTQVACNMFFKYNDFIDPDPKISIQKFILKYIKYPSKTFETNCKVYFRVNTELMPYLKQFYTSVVAAFPITISFYTRNGELVIQFPDQELRDLCLKWLGDKFPNPSHNEKNMIHLPAYVQEGKLVVRFDSIRQREQLISILGLKKSQFSVCKEGNDLCINDPMINTPDYCITIEAPKHLYVPKDLGMYVSTVYYTHRIAEGFHATGSFFKMLPKELNIQVAALAAAVQSGVEEENTREIAANLF